MVETEVLDTIQQYLPNILLVIGGLMAIAIAWSYHKDKESRRYKGLMVLGTVLGLLIGLVALTDYGKWTMFTTLVIAVLAFALIIRPFREVHFALILAVLVMALIYIALGDLSFGNVDISMITDNPGRLIVAFLLGAVFYMIFHFAEMIVKGIGKVLNWWPLLLVLGVFCIAEGIIMLSGHTFNELLHVEDLGLLIG